LAQESLITINYEQSSDGEQKVDIKLGSPELTVFPPTLLSTKEFAMRVLDTVNKSLESTQSTVTPVPTDAKEPQTTPKATPTKEAKMNVALRLHELSVQLVDGSTSKEEKLATVSSIIKPD
jgi:hypothetical protein